MLLLVIIITVVIILSWNWDWFIPLVDRQASTAIGRKVTIAHLHVRLGRTTRIVADNVAVAGTDAFPGDLATVQHLTLDVELMPLLRHFQIVLPLIDLDHPVVDARSDATARNNWSLAFRQDKTSQSNASAGPKIGILRIEDGHIHVQDARLRADFAILVETRGTPDPADRPLPADQGQIVASARGTYAGQPITGTFTGGALLSLRDKARPYPIDLEVANGPTHAAIKGTIEQPLTFAGARLRLIFFGPDMSLLYALTSVPIPQTPPYRVEGMLDYSSTRIAFQNFHGAVGTSDLNGSIAVIPSQIPTVDADLSSRRVDLADLGGFIGSSPANSAKAGGTTAQRAQIAAAKSSGDILPTTKFNLPKIKAATIHLSYRGAHIENPDVPLDNIVTKLNIQHGDIQLKQLDFAVGAGDISSSASLVPDGRSLRTKAHIDFHRINLSRLMQATHAFKGEGIVGGRADLSTNGSSVAEMLGNGDGGITLVMSGGGNISALLPDIAGLELGNAILSALGVPQRAQIQCFVADMPLKSGILSTNAFLLQTSEARSVGKGTIDFRNQTLDFSLTTRSTHFSVGSLPGPINLTGKLGKPSVLPGAEVVARAGAAAGLGVVLPPLALLPTIQLGVGDSGACKTAFETVASHPATASHVEGHRHR